MNYHSTRSLDESLTSRGAVLKGLADDGGLFVTDMLSETTIAPTSLLGGNYVLTARRVLGALLPDYTSEEIADAVEAAYGATFTAPEVTPVTRLGELALLELYHGPTAAFKDVALCMLPQLMSKALRGSERRIMIATATSGDTGKAALEGFRDVPNIGITVLYPEGGVSAIQQLQMATQAGENVTILAVKGNFDDAQSAVKALFANDVVKKQLERMNVSLSSANSINIGRLVPQIVYYFEAWRQLVERNTIRPDELVDFTVPTGNFGDILAGWCAKRMGLPVGRLIVASNANNVLTDFLKTGVYDRRRALQKTLSPSMDILVSSNLERVLYWLDAELEGPEVAAAHTRERMAQLATNGYYTVSDALLARLQTEFGYGFADDSATRESIHDAWEKDGRLIDPHTAIARRVALENLTPGRQMVVLSTASPYKFCSAVYEAIFGELPLNASPFDLMDALEARTQVPAPTCLKSLRDRPVRWTETRDIAEVPNRVLEAAKTRIH